MRSFVFLAALFYATSAIAQLGGAGFPSTGGGGGGATGTGPTFVSIPTAGSIASTSAVISSTTSTASTGKVYYATTANPFPGGTVVGPDSSSTSHAQTLSSLTASTTYHF